jgi:hypothetical protein
MFDLSIIDNAKQKVQTSRGLDGLPTQLAFLPLHHSYGLHQYCFRALVAPQTLVVLGQWNIKTALDLIQR